MAYQLRAYAASASADSSHTIVVENKQTGQKWEINSSSANPAQQFTLLPMRPRNNSLTVVDNRTGKVRSAFFFLSPHIINMLIDL